MVTLAEADLRAFGDVAADATTEGPAAGTPPETAEPLSEDSDGVRRVEPADGPSGGASGVVVTGEEFGGSGAVAVVVVVASVVVPSVVVPASCAAEIAGIAQLSARTSIPLARAFAPFILRIVLGIDS